MGSHGECLRSPYVFHSLQRDDINPPSHLKKNAHSFLSACEEVTAPEFYPELTPEREMWHRCLGWAFWYLSRGSAIHRRQEYAWFMADEPDRIGSFAWICDNCGFDRRVFRLKARAIWQGSSVFRPYLKRHRVR